MEKVLIAIAVMAVGLVVAMIIRRRTESGPAQGKSWTVPVQLHRADFVLPELPTLIVVFSSATCESCAATWAKVQAHGGGGVAVQDVTYQRDKALHDRYDIDAVPTVVIADSEGVVVASFIGEPSDEDLQKALEALD